MVKAVYRSRVTERSARPPVTASRTFQTAEDIIPIAPVTGAKVKERWIKCDERRRFLGHNRGSSQTDTTHSGFLRRSLSGLERANKSKG